MNVGFSSSASVCFIYTKLNETKHIIFFYARPSPILMALVVYRIWLAYIRHSLS